MKSRYLTKTRFKLANECPTELFYTAKKGIYADQALEDPLLAALAEGGFQVGEFATALFPGGERVNALEYEEALARTAELLARGDELQRFLEYGQRSQNGIFIFSAKAERLDHRCRLRPRRLRSSRTGGR